MMKDKRKRYYVSVMTLVGTVIGVGVFGIPYAISKVGVVTALIYFVVLGGIQLLQNLFYAEAAIVCDDKARLIGLTGRYVGKKARHVAAWSSVLGFWGGMLAYIIVGGTFLHLLFGPVIGGSEFAYQVIWALVGGLVIYFGIEFVSKIDFFSTLTLIVALLIILGFSVPEIRLSNLTLFSSENLFLPYGVILFSLSGLAAVPEMEDILRGKHKYFRRSVVVGSLIATILTAAFGFIVYGVTGMGTTTEAVVGLQGVLGGWISVLAAAFGFLAVVTSFFIIGTNLKESFEYDYGMHKVPSWLLAAGVPVIVFLLGAKSFIAIVSFTGAVFGGVTAILVATLYIMIVRNKINKEKPLGFPLWLAYVSIVVLGAGAIYAMVTTVLQALG